MLADKITVSNRDDSIYIRPGFIVQFAFPIICFIVLFIMAGCFFIRYPVRILCKAIFVASSSLDSVGYVDIKVEEKYFHLLRDKYSARFSVGSESLKNDAPIERSFFFVSKGDYDDGYWIRVNPDSVFTKGKSGFPNDGAGPFDVLIYFERINLFRRVFDKEYR